MRGIGLFAAAKRDGAVWEPTPQQIYARFVPKFVLACSTESWLLLAPKLSMSQQLSPKLSVSQQHRHSHSRRAFWEPSPEAISLAREKFVPANGYPTVPDIGKAHRFEGI